MPKTGLDLDQVIIVANNEGMPIKKRAIALKMLQKIGNPESLFTICSVASTDQSQIALYSRKIVATFEYVQLEAILNYALESSEGHFVEKQILGFIYEAPKQDLLRYLLGELGNYPRTAFLARIRNPNPVLEPASKETKKVVTHG